MLTVISPAKSLDLTPVAQPPLLAPTQPAWQADAVRLAKTMRGQTLGQLRRLMNISPDLARLNRDRFRGFTDAPAPESVKPAVLAFNGDTYQGFEAATLDAADLEWAQDHLRILSGLYGLLRPLDAIQPYRLEMGSRLKTRRGDTLYDYWGNTIAKALMAQAQSIGTDTLVNCASQEYFAAAARKPLKLRVITPLFYELRDGKPQMVSFFAKRARGAMARFIVTNRLTDPAAIRDFGAGGYAFDPDLSEDDRWAFVRPYPDTP
jgi:cytoplasmic iron level regulating protein YaaA (DUF328/UPF0246 family)